MSDFRKLEQSEVLAKIYGSEASVAAVGASIGGVVLRVAGADDSDVGENHAPESVAVVSVALIKDVAHSVASNSRLKSVFRKGRAFISGGGAKPYKQKGTGRARAGSTRSSIRVGGAAAHGGRRVRVVRGINSRCKTALSKWIVSSSSCYEFTPSSISMSEIRNGFKLAVKGDKLLSTQNRILVVVDDGNTLIQHSLRNLQFVSIVSSNRFGVGEIGKCNKAIVFAGDSFNTLSSRLN